MSAPTSHRRFPGHVGMVALMPHAPILIPSIAGHAAESVQASILASAEVAARVVAEDPDAVVVISPHVPRRRSAFGIRAGGALNGSLGGFGAPGVNCRFLGAPSLGARVARHGAEMGVETWLIDDMPLDHGALVPLWHLREAGWGGATLVVGLPVAQSANPALLGRALAAAVREEGGRVAVIASGDMSHRLAANGPNGQDPDAAEFEAKFLSIVRRGEYRELEGLDRGLRVVAAEDAVDSMIAASAAVGWASENRELLSYEAPYGVGYAIAVLHYPRRGAAVAAPGVQPLPAVARQAIADEVRGRGGGPPPPLDPALAKRHGVFVTLIGPSGAVRGCMGTIEPTQPDTVAETWANARAAAFKDPRFPPVRADDLGTLRLEVNVIGEMEPVASEHLLDPERFGVNVRALDGRCATVLPGVPSIRSGGDQIAVARRRAGIAPGEPIAMFRFAVERHEEVPGGAGGGA